MTPHAVRPRRDQHNPKGMDMTTIINAVRPLDDGTFLPLVFDKDLKKFVDPPQAEPSRDSWDSAMARSQQLNQGLVFKAALS